ncbi:WecB/TagA/CpsF family glycosyltransferase [Treponema sp. R6D11]
MLVLDVLAGVVKRAPLLYRKLHLEWLYRAMADHSRFERLFVIPHYLKAVRQQRRDERRG